MAEAPEQQLYVDPRFWEHHIARARLSDLEGHHHLAGELNRRHGTHSRGADAVTDVVKRSRRASTVACVAARAGPVLPTTRKPSITQTNKRAAFEGSTPSTNSPAAFARVGAAVSRVSIALKNLTMRRSTSASWAASSRVVAATRHPRRPLASLARST